MATNIKKKKVSELPEATDTTGFWIFGSKTVGGAVTSVKFAFDKIISLFGVTQEKGQSVTLAPSQKAWTDETIVNDKRFYNVSQSNNIYNYASKQAARSDVNVSLREKGQIITYKLESGDWITETFKGDSLSEWSNNIKWDRNIFAADLDYIEKPADPSTENWFNASEITPNKSLSNTNGSEVTNAIASITNYIPISTGDVVRINSDRVISFYDNNKKLVSFLKNMDESPSQDKRAITITGTYSYIRFTILNEWVGTTYCYINYDPDNVSEVDKFNKDGITPNKSLSGGSGLEVPLNTTSISNYIPISKGSHIRFNSDRVVSFYDSNKTLISFLKALDDNPSQDIRNIDITEDYAFVRFTIMNEWLNTSYCYVSESESASGNSGVPSTKILHKRKPIDGVFTTDKEEVVIDAHEVLIRSKRLPDYLDSLTYNPKIYEYDLRKNIVNAAILPDNSVVAAIGNKIVKYGLDGFETILLEINSVSDWRCVWHHSSGAVFFSPMNSYTNGTDASNYGLYKYDGANVNKVLQLANRQSIWGIDEDNEGNIYAGVYSLGVNNSELYKSIDGNTFSKIYDWNTKHIHALAVDKSNDALYVSVGDNYSASQNFKSIDGGISFTPVIDSMRRQMTAILPSGNLRFFGTDHSPLGVIYKTSDDNTLEVSLNVGYYSNVFFLRKSDLTGWIYAGFKTDPSATSNLYCSVWVSKDEGSTWEIVKEINVVSAGEGFWFASNFKDGNMIVGYKLNNEFKGLGISELIQPIYDSDGITGTIIKPIINN
ncbi:MAG: WD40/YVTN/BNR-like repeat-containing protein [Parachlamydiaceae bacterium]